MIAAGSVLFLYICMSMVENGWLQRVCELQGTCQRCEQNRIYSFYTCHTSMDCFPEEYCTPQRFCCPISTLPSQIPASAESIDQASTAMVGMAEPNAPRCPDGSDWLRMCKTDNDCIFRDEVCAEGKCCPSCKQRRAQVLTEISRAGEHLDSSAIFIPQCSEDGSHYHPMQCSQGTNNCFCVTKFGRQIAPTNSTERTNCTEMRRTQIIMEKGGLKSWKMTKSSDKEKPILLLNSTDEINHERRNREDTQTKEENEKSSLGFLEIGRDGIQKSKAAYVTPSTNQPSVHRNSPSTSREESGQCADPLREFKTCGSSCPISCATRTQPKCQTDECLRGCFCRLPYVILDVENPFTSKCVLPAECPMLPFTSDLNSWDGGFFPAITNSNQANQDVHSVSWTKSNNPIDKCSDPLKNFHTCGSACPPACGLLQPDCGQQCVSGCFCRAPYVLKDQSDINSPCILRQHCPDFRYESECKEPNKVWTSCTSKKCPRSCDQWSPLCLPDDCKPGCECRLPYISFNTSSSSNCVLPEQCPQPTTQQPSLALAPLQFQESKCEDSNKEFHSCASSCPLGCDNLDLQLCTPCVAGCFCKNGYIFENASNWRHSRCVQISECPNKGNRAVAFSPNTGSIQPINPVSASSCPVNPVDKNGRTCDTDFECGFQQKCCPVISNQSQHNISSLPIHKCTCLDTNAIWMECGTVCPDYCPGESEQTRTKQENCPKICRPGCFCVAGFIKKNSDANSECIPISKCPRIGQDDDIGPEFTTSQASMTTSTQSTPTTEENNEEDSCGEALASAVLYSSTGARLGRLLVRPDRRKGKNENRRIRITGELTPYAATSIREETHFLAIHQFSDTTIDGCKNVGSALVMNILEEDDNGFVVTTSASEFEIGPSHRFRSERPADPTKIVIRIDKVLLWSDPITVGTNPLIGHSVVLKTYNNSKPEGFDIRKQKMVACAVLGIVPSC
ncbi:trypsin inhibitor like cysteine rich domain-containing protein [Ditylenchus destructor]|uniref:Trypsin inhibitor like cysteine rich domain-containing protein n=1 Tax=Ditylenchus destructor TaxID=166010 RepID=A0AAD4NDT1_9BILA|nr:trypsin inhibitor like cysteine rich domain-containing protein [Ditylenchus destructor]